MDVLSCNTFILSPGFYYKAAKVRLIILLETTITTRRLNIILLYVILSFAMPIHSTFYVALSLNELFLIYRYLSKYQILLHQWELSSVAIISLMQERSHGLLKKMEDLLPVIMDSRIFHRELKDKLVPRFFQESQVQWQGHVMYKPQHFCCGGG